jgi:hypothetical protein
MNHLTDVTVIFKRLLVLVCLFAHLTADAQKKKIALKDSLDGAFDLSDYIIDAHGFIPVPILITEPALGGFGGGLIPVFIQKNPPYIDSINGKVKITPVAPNLTGAAALYTVNNTWALLGFRQGTLVKSRIKYTIGGGYANINMSYYRPVETTGDKEFAFNIKTIPLLLQGTKRIATSYWYTGLKYVFLKTDTKYTGDRLLPPDLAKPAGTSAIVSQLGAIIEIDKRDNIFTPNKGIKIHFDANRSDNVIGSDYDFWRLNYYTYGYTKLANKLTGAIRIDAQQAFGDVPFYMLPYIDMRGVPINRYQGNADILTEGELRWDFIKRWSLLLYSGAGKAFDEWSDFDDAKLVVTYGSGFRYFIARKFGLRMGVDIAKGPDTWAYYIVFGSSLV